jgi:lipopolysaccharide export system protein LptA
LAFGIGFCLLLMAPLAFAATNINVSADRQTYDEATGRTVFRGNVNVKTPDMRIQAQEGALEMGTEGGPGSAVFTKRPTAIRSNAGGSDDRIEADTIRLLLKENTFRAEGNVVSYLASASSGGPAMTIRSQSQQFQGDSKNFSAAGNVQVNFKEMRASSSRVMMKMGPNGQPDRIVFAGGARLIQGPSTISAEQITIMAGSENLIAERNTTTRVDLAPRPGAPATNIVIRADYQQYDKASDTMLASGKVRIQYEDYLAAGPKATFKLKDNSVDKIYLSGRPTIDEKDRQVTADSITISTVPKRFDAVGRVQTRLRQQEGAGSSQTASADTPAKARPAGKNKSSSPKSAATVSPRPAVNKPKPVVIYAEEDEM